MHSGQGLGYGQTDVNIHQISIGIGCFQCSYVENVTAIFLFEFGLDLRGVEIILIDQLLFAV